VLKKFGVCAKHFDLFLNILSTDKVQETLTFLNDQILALQTQIDKLSKGEESSQLLKNIRQFRSMRIQTISKIPQVRRLEEEKAEGSSSEVLFSKLLPKPSPVPKDSPSVVSQEGRQESKNVKSEVVEERGFGSVPRSLDFVQQQQRERGNHFVYNFPPLLPPLSSLFSS